MNTRNIFLRTMIVMAFVFTSVARASDLPFRVHFSGYADLGLVLTDDVPSWLDAGAGKGRYGANRNGGDEFKAVIPEAVFISDIMFGTSTSFHLQVKYDDEQRHELDIGEVFVLYRSPPRPNLRWRIKVGSFLPPMSLENHAIGWTSPYTLSSSALNAWLGEEIRINGADLRFRFNYRDTEIALSGAMYLGNDAAGSLIGYRGFAIHDRELALFDNAPLPDFQTKIISPFGPFRLQAHAFEPLHEIDGKPGFYGGIDIRNDSWGKFLLYFYDNNADPEKVNRTAGQFAWRTRFVTAGYRGDIANGLTVVLQALYGDTVSGPRVPPKRKRISDVNYLTAYALLSKSYRRWRYSGRMEYFETTDQDTLRDNYDNDESGWAATGTLMFNPIESIKLAIEVQYIDHERPIRQLTGLPVRFDELAARANLRWFF